MKISLGPLAIFMSRANSPGPVLAGGPLIHFIFIFSLTLSLKLHADTFVARIMGAEKIDSRTYLLKFSNGRVAFVKSEDEFVQDRFYEAKVSRKQELMELRPVEIWEEKNLKSLAQDQPLLDTIPTILSESESNHLFMRLNSNYKRSSECSNRAHVWAWEEFSKNKIISEKVYVLFTASYINRHRFKWWFHVAPLFTVTKGNTAEKMVFDYMFNASPVSIKKWTDGFVFSQRPCRYTERFSEYDVNPQTEDCYLMIDSMFTWNPMDLKNQELTGSYKTQFSRGEINFAYKQAF